MENLMKYIVFGIILLNILIGLTNIIVEFVKRLTWDKVNTNYVAAVVGIALTVAALFALAAVLGFAVLWYYILAAVLLGILVSYGAMVGYDKLWSQIKSIAKQTQNSVGEASGLTGGGKA
ncbi:hypothetical protein [uncultured Dysosmobacter sp.]|uniref:hypothetical protein n=1 Tax=uncultured Dysosmobacter sp. TaxID=2591384 RepID=UPI0026315B4E|nr:hypothetical protein [uncultured Dysosmobacter sp.]